jgi:hypothetical protein
MFCALISEEPETELFDATKTLELSRVDQSHHQFAFIVVSSKSNDVMDRISVDAFSHCKKFTMRD